LTAVKEAVFAVISKAANGEEDEGGDDGFHGVLGAVDSRKSDCSDKG
jgi:hypothetical protein